AGQRMWCVARARAPDRGPGLRKGTEDHEPCRHNRNAGTEADALERIPNGRKYAFLKRRVRWTIMGVNLATSPSCLLSRSLRIRWIRADCGLQQRCYSLFWPLVSSSTAPSMTIFARRRLILCPRQFQI